MAFSEGSATFKLGNLGAGLFSLGLFRFDLLLVHLLICKTGVLPISSVVEGLRDTQLSIQVFIIYAC